MACRDLVGANIPTREGCGCEDLCWNNSVLHLHILSIEAISRSLYPTDLMC